MKHPNRHTVSRLEELPNVGKATAGDFHTIGIDRPQDLIGQDAYRMYDTLCETTGTRHDPCMIDVFLSAVDFMEGGDPRPWWSFTEERKEKLGQSLS